MAGRGPGQKHPSTRARRNASTAGVVFLPSEGRKGPTPVWPLPSDRSLASSVLLADLDIEELGAAVLDAEVEDDREELSRLRRELRHARARLAVARNDQKIAEKGERALWVTLWKLPQAVQWERLGYLNEVAQYVRWKTRAELGELAASKESRLLSDKIGLTPVALKSLGWWIATDEVAEAREDRAPPAARRTQATKTPARKPADPRAALRAV